MINFKDHVRIYMAMDIMRKVTGVLCPSAIQTGGDLNCVLLLGSF